MSPTCRRSESFDEIEFPGNFAVLADFLDPRGWHSGAVSPESLSHLPKSSKLFSETFLLVLIHESILGKSHSVDCLANFVSRVANTFSLIVAEFELCPEFVPYFYLSVADSVNCRVYAKLAEMQNTLVNVFKKLIGDHNFANFLRMALGIHLTLNDLKTHSIGKYLESML
jgi:hypothetical protein